ncbi:MAG: hypothetical protein ACLGHQ_13710 [Acidimicrobiia bacterium]
MRERDGERCDRRDRGGGSDELWLGCDDVIGFDGGTDIDEFDRARIHDF